MNNNLREAVIHLTITIRLPDDTNLNELVPGGELELTQLVNHGGIHMGVFGLTNADLKAIWKK